MRKDIIAISICYYFYLLEIYQILLIYQKKLKNLLVKNILPNPLPN